MLRKLALWKPSLIGDMQGPTLLHHNEEVVRQHTFSHLGISYPRKPYSPFSSTLELYYVVAAQRMHARPLTFNETFRVEARYESLQTGLIRF
jgi:hypothetical protein